MSMYRFTVSSFIGLFFCCISMLSAPAWAEEVQVTQREAPSTATVPLRVFSGLGAPLNESRLADMRGGDVHVNKQELSAKLSETSASNLTTGSNTISEGSFANANGLPIVIQNSGNGVIIQNSTILNLNVK